MFIFICPIAIAYSMGQIKNRFASVCQCVYLSLCEHTHGRISRSIFTKNWHIGKTPQEEERLR